MEMPASINWELRTVTRGAALAQPVADLEPRAAHRSCAHVMHGTIDWVQRRRCHVSRAPEFTHPVAAWKSGATGSTVGRRSTAMYRT